MNPTEPYYVKETRRRAFVEGMHAGTYFLIPRGVSQAAACDGNVYAIPQGAVVTNAISTNLPLLREEPNKLNVRNIVKSCDTFIMPYIVSLRP